MAEWLGSGLQIHVRRFDSGSHLQQDPRLQRHSRSLQARKGLI